MTTALLTNAIWPELTRAAKTARGTSHIAVAYFSRDAQRRLPLKKRDILVVNAGMNAVQTGQTSPAALLALVKRGVGVYSSEDLHAKVFQFGSVVYVGSTNVSFSSEQRLSEAVLRTNDKKSVSGAKAFIVSRCTHLMTPEYLRVLEKHYPTGRMFGAPKRRKAVDMNTQSAVMPDTHLVQLARIPWSEATLHAAEVGAKVAEGRRRHDKGYVV